VIASDCRERGNLEIASVALLARKDSAGRKNELAPIYRGVMGVAGFNLRFKTQTEVCYSRKVGMFLTIL